LRHGYDIVSVGEIWIMASEQVPQLAKECTNALNALENKPR